jgi:hypothetical protein
MLPLLPSRPRQQRKKSCTVTLMATAATPVLTARPLGLTIKWQQQKGTKWEERKAIISVASGVSKNRKEGRHQLTVLLINKNYLNLMSPPHLILLQQLPTLSALAITFPAPFPSSTRSQHETASQSKFRMAPPCSQPILYSSIFPIARPMLVRPISFQA